MIIKSTEELADFTRLKVEKSKLGIPEIAEIAEISTKSVDNGISKNQRSNPGRNGNRRKILRALGYEVAGIFEVKRIKK